MSNEYISSIGKDYNLTVNFVSNNADLARQNFEDTSWYRRFYSLKKLGLSNIFNLNPDIVIEETDDNGSRISDNSLENTINDAVKAKNYYSVFTASDKNIVFATISLSGDLTFIEDSILLLKENSSEEEINRLISKICEYTSKVAAIFRRDIDSNNISMVKYDVIGYLLADICMKLGSGFFDFENNIQRLWYIIEDSLKSLFRSENEDPVMYSILLNQNDMYRTIINKVMSGQEELENKAIERGILIGSKFFAAFQRAGYFPEVDTSRWEKKVDIVPEYCIYNGELFQIPEQYRKFKVETLYFDSNALREEVFIINAKNAYHPNISSSGQVCIGDELCTAFRKLIRNRGLMTQEYVNFLISVEDALKVINFDSSYESFSSATGVSGSDVLIRANVCNADEIGGTIKGSLRRV
jgi:hypothetical protein